MEKIPTKPVVLLCAITLLVLGACHYNPNAGLNDESPTRGKIKIGVDESFTLIAEAELYTFQSIYTDAHITPFFKPEMDVLNDFMNDSIRLMITSRNLTKQEVDYLHSKQIYPVTTKFAYDGIAFIVNNKNKDSLIRYNTIKDIFLGKINYWNQITSSNSSGKLKVVFDNNKSSNVRYFREKFGIKDSFPKNCYAVENNNEVINYVEKNANCIGVVGVNWVSDKNDSITRGFLKRVKVVAISAELNSDGDDFYRPYQGFIADKSYPFIRDVYSISRETFLGLGSGFNQFIAGEKGQRIVLKMGMVPATMPVRMVKIRDSY
jgi:phosphate transport system substrate-binding protein